MTRTRSDQQPPTPEIIAIISQMEGIGATTTAVNLTLALAAAGRHVLLMDLDPQGHASHSLGHDGHGRGGTESALLEARITREMITATKIPGVYLAPAGAGLGGIESELALMDDSYTRLYQALATLHELSLDFDHVVLDCPSSLDPLLTRNALVAAHRVLLPLPCDPVALEDLPMVLKTISLLRACLVQPLYGVYLLMSISTASASAQALIATVREDYARMTLLSEIPADDAIKETATRDQPLLVHCPTCEVSRAYLSLAAEWLTLSEQGDQPDGTWRFKARQERMARHREDMGKGIESWLIDPSLRLYEADEAMRHQDVMALEELFQATQPIARSRFFWRHGWATLLAGLLVLLVVSANLLLRGLGPDEQWRIELGAWMIGAERYWLAGSVLLSRADDSAYRELVLATQLVEKNRGRLMICAEQARERGITACTIDVPTPTGRHDGHVFRQDIQAMAVRPNGQPVSAVDASGGARMDGDGQGRGNAPNPAHEAKDG